MPTSSEYIVKILKNIDAVYNAPPMDKERENLRAMNWYALFKDYPQEIVSSAFKLCLMSCHRIIVPADIFEKIEDIKKSREASDNELWSELLASLKTRIDNRKRWSNEDGFDIGKANKDLYNSLSPVLKAYIGGYNAFLDLTYERVVGSYTEKNRFFSSLGDARAKVRADEAMSEKCRAAINGESDIKLLETTK